MRIAARVSHPVAAARATRERANADVTAARSGYLPQIFGTGSYVRTLETEFEGLFDAPAADPAAAMTGSLFGNLPFGRDHTWRAGIDVTQWIWDGGRTSATVALAKTARTLAELDESGQRAQAVLNVTDAYYGAVLADRLVAIGESSLALAEQTLANATLGYQQGSTAEFDMVRAEVTRDNQRTSVVRARADREVAFVRLRQLLGVPLDRPLVLTSELAPASELSARSTARVPVVAERLSVAQARSNLEARRAQVGLATSARWPAVSAFTSYGLVDYPTSFWPDSDWRKNWTVGVNLTVPIFTGFRITSEIRGAKADRRAAEALLAEAVEQAEVDEHRSRTAVEVAAATLAASTRSAALARRAYQIAEVRYREGVSTYLELSDARLALDQAQVNQASAARDLQVARVRIALLPLLPLGTPPAAPSIPETVIPSAEPTPSGTATQPGGRVSGPAGAAR